MADGDDPALPDVNDFMARYHREQAGREANARLWFGYYAGMLRGFGVRTVRAEFDGYGDSGQVESVAFDPAPPAGLPDGLATAIERLVYDVLPGGWEINEGSSGAVTLDTATGAAEVDIEYNEEDEFVDGDDEDGDSELDDPDLGPDDPPAAPGGK